MPIGIVAYAFMGQPLSKELYMGAWMGQLSHRAVYLTYMQKSRKKTEVPKPDTKTPKKQQVALAKQNGDSMTEKQNILRPSLKVTIHQPLLIMSKPRVSKIVPYIRLARGKFELTNQDSGGGKNSSVLM